MKYEETTAEERELILFIENDEEAFKTVMKHAEEKPRTTDAVRAAAYKYKRINANTEDNLFTLDNLRNVRNYFRDVKVPEAQEFKANN